MLGDEESLSQWERVGGEGIQTIDYELHGNAKTPHPAGNRAAFSRRERAVRCTRPVKTHKERGGDAAVADRPMDPGQPFGLPGRPRIVAGAASGAGEGGEARAGMDGRDLAAHTASLPGLPVLGLDPRTTATHAAGL